MIVYCFRCGDTVSICATSPLDVNKSQLKLILYADES